jgi:hypothetical protein
VQVPSRFREALLIIVVPVEDVLHSDLQTQARIRGRIPPKSIVANLDAGTTIPALFVVIAALCFFHLRNRRPDSGADS